MLTIKELELLEFFEVEPKKFDDSPWPYNHFVYEVRKDGLILSCTLDPADKDIEIKIIRNDFLLYQFYGEDVQEIRFLKENSEEVLEVTIDKRNTMSIKLRPSFSIVHSTTRK